MLIEKWAFKSYSHYKYCVASLYETKLNLLIIRDLPQVFTRIYKTEETTYSSWQGLYVNTNKRHFRSFSNELQLRRKRVQSKKIVVFGVEGLTRFSLLIPKPEKNSNLFVNGINTFACEFIRLFVLQHNDYTENGTNLNLFSTVINQCSNQTYSVLQHTFSPCIAIFTEYALVRCGI